MNQQNRKEREKKTKEKVAAGRVNQEREIRALDILIICKCTPQQTGEIQSGVVFSFMLRLYFSLVLYCVCAI